MGSMPKVMFLEVMSQVQRILYILSVLVMTMEWCWMTTVFVYTPFCNKPMNQVKLHMLCLLQAADYRIFLRVIFVCQLLYTHEVLFRSLSIDGQPWKVLALGHIQAFVLERYINTMAVSSERFRGEEVRFYISSSHHFHYHQPVHCNNMESLSKSFENPSETICVGCGFQFYNKPSLKEYIPDYENCERASSINSFFFLPAFSTVTTQPAKQNPLLSHHTNGCTFTNTRQRAGITHQGTDEG